MVESYLPSFANTRAAREPYTLVDGGHSSPKEYKHEEYAKRHAAMCKDLADTVCLGGMMEGALVIRNNS